MVPTQERSSAYRQQIAAPQGAAIVFVALLLIVGMTSLAIGSNAFTRGNWLFPTFTMLSTAVFLAITIVRNPRRLISLTFLLYFYLFMGLAAVAQISVSRFPIATNHGTRYSIPPHGDVRLAGALTFIGVAAAMIAMASSSLNRRERPVETPKGDNVATARPARLVLATVVGVLVCLILMGLRFPVLSRTERTAQVASHVGDDLALYAVAISVAYVPPMAAWLVLLRAWARGVPLRETFGLRVIALVAFGLLLTANPIGAPRFWTATAAMALLAAWSLRLRARRGQIGIAALLVAVTIFVFPLADAFRRDVSLSNLHSAGIRSELINSPDYDSFPVAITATGLVSQQGHSSGSRLLAVALALVPRRVLPSKPVDSGVLIARYLEQDFTNVSVPLPVEIYIDFGLIGVALALFLYGGLVRRFDGLLFGGGGPVGQTLALGMVGYQVILLRGSLLQASTNLIALWLCLIVLYRRTARHAETLPAPAHPLPR